MARRVDQIERVDLPVGGGVIERDGAGLDRDAALALQVHVVKDLVLHLARRNGVALFKQPIRQRRLAVVDVRDDGKISDVLFVHSCCSCLLSARRRRAPNGASRRFALGQNLAAGRIHFARGCSIKRVPARASALVGKRLAVVDVRDDGKISDVLFVHSCCSCLLSARRRCAPNGASKRFAAGEILISCRAGNWPFLRCCGVPASRSA